MLLVFQMYDQFYLNHVIRSYSKSVFFNYPIILLVYALYHYPF